MVMSFGFTGAPGEWAPWGLATSALHRSYVPEDVFSCGPWAYHSHILVDDAILVEPRVGLRAEMSAHCYEENTKALLGDGAVNQEKVELEGSFGCEATVWGLTMNTEENTVGLPEQRLLKGAHLLALPVYSAGNHEMTLKDIQKLRGTAQSWTTVLPGLRLVLRAVDCFLSPGNPDDFVQPHRDQRADEAWTRLWAAIDLLKLLVSRPELWKERFISSMDRLLTVSEQLGLPGAEQWTRVVSSDATPELHGAVDWKARKVTRQEVEPFMAHLKRQGEELPTIIAVAELLGLVAMAAALGHTWQNELIIYIGDNSNVVHWLRSRAPRNRLAQLLMRTLMCLEVKLRFSIQAYYVRTYHNKTADWLTRCTQEEFEAGIRERRLEWVSAELPWAEALAASERGDSLFLVGMDAADMQVAQALTGQHISRSLKSGTPFLEGWRLCDMDGNQGDYAAVWSSWGGAVISCHTSKKSLYAGAVNDLTHLDLPDVQSVSTNSPKKLLCAGTAPPDPSGVKGLRLARQAVSMGADAVILEAPKNHPWSRAEGYLRGKGWTVTVFEFETTALGAALWRRRSSTLALKTGIGRPRTPAELDLTTVIGTPARHYLREEDPDSYTDDCW
eukprot:1122779-Amphidinium_carterae.2